jgi:hypothetical protein
VTRNGHVLEIDAEEVVPGDVIHLEDVSASRTPVSHTQQLINLTTGHHRSGRWSPGQRRGPPPGRSVFRHR